MNTQNLHLELYFETSNYRSMSTDYFQQESPLALIRPAWYFAVGGGYPYYPGAGWKGWRLGEGGLPESCL